jgi:HEAT repeat protein
MMIGVRKIVCQHEAENVMLIRALEGDLNSVNQILNYLSSSNKYLRRIMQDAIHDFSDQKIWDRLLQCLAEHRWEDHPDCVRRKDMEASERIDLSIEELFVSDENDWEKQFKEQALRRSSEEDSQALRWTKAYLLGLRGHLEVIPILARIIESGKLEWQLRAVKTLAALDHEECAPHLVKALAQDRDKLHQEALRALSRMGEKAKLAWLSALSHPDSHIRWHAARGLGQAGDASSIRILAEGLLDDNHAVRWATADLLAYLGDVSVPVVLELILQYPLAEPFRESAYHALHSITSQATRERLKPLLKVLDSPTARIEAPVEAQQILREWDLGKQE